MLIPSRMSVERKPKILVIDDSEICLDVVADALEQAGFEVATSNRSLGASRLLSELNPDVVVVDIGMPALDGATLVQIIRRNPIHECAVLLHTDRDRSDLEAAIASSGADGGACKSADSSELIGLIQTTLLSHGWDCEPA